jgi:hypothetical protein
VRVTKGDTRKVLLQVQLWSQKPTSAGVQTEPRLEESPKPFSTEAATDMHVEPLTGLPSKTPLTAGDTAAVLGGDSLPKKADEPTSSARDASAEMSAESQTGGPSEPPSADREALQADALPEEVSSAKIVSAPMPTEPPRSVAGLNVAEEQLGDPSRLPSVAVNPPANVQAASLPEAAFLTLAGVLEKGKAAGTLSPFREEEQSTEGGVLKERELTREGAQERAWALWPSKAVRELNLDAAHRALPALADVALPCQLAAAVATWQTRKTLRDERTAERGAEREAARVYGVLEEEECTAARVRKALQEAKAAARAAEKAELAEKRRRAREARRRAAEGVNGAEVNAPCADELDDLEDVPIGSLAVSADKAGLGTGQPEDASSVVVRRRLRGRRRAIEEDDDVSDLGADVITAPGAPGGRAPPVDSSSGRPKSGDASLLDQACSVCGRTDGEESMLLCDEGRCQGALHTYCAEPPIEEVPEGDWFCMECPASRKAIGVEVGGLKRFDEKEGVERPGSEGAVELEEAREPLSQSADEATRRQRPDCGQPEGEGVDELERVKESPVARVEAALCQQRAKDGHEGLQNGAGCGREGSSGGVHKLERVEGSLVQSAEEALCPQGAGCGQFEEEGLQKDGGWTEGSKIQSPSAPPLEEVAEPQVEKLRALVSGASRQAVAISAAVWGLTDDLSASELMSRPRGSESVADAAPGCEEGDDMEGRVPRQAAACLAYTSLRWRSDTCQLGRTAGGGTGDGQFESTDRKREAELETAKGTAPSATGSGVLGGTVGGSPGSLNPPHGREVIGNGTRLLANPLDDNGRGVDAGIGAVSRWTEYEWALGGPGRILAAAGDGAALSGFLAAGEGDAEPGWLQLQLGAVTEQRGVER